MKRKLDLTITDLLNSNWGREVKVNGYEIRDYSDNSEEDFSTYNDWVNIISQYYDGKSYVEETEEQKMLRLAKEKRENRNNTIDKILNDKA
jgi:hypothetical protein